jgi:hypothetical protein
MHQNESSDRVRRWATLLSLTILLSSCTGGFPNPTITGSSSATSPVATTSSLLFQDDFQSIRSGWLGPTGQYDGRSVRELYIDGQLQMGIRATTLRAWALLDESSKVQSSGRSVVGRIGDVTLAADARLTSKPLPGRGYGLICRETRANGGASWYEFAIVYGHAAILRMTGLPNQSVSMKPLADVATPLLNKFREGTHRIEATCSGTLLSLSIDGHLVAQATDQDLLSGFVGMGIFGPSPITVRFDNLSIFGVDLT